MPKFEMPEKPKKGKGDDDKSSTGKIVEPRCSVCQHAHRNVIDKLLAMQTSYSEIERLFSVDRRAASNHAKEHLGYEEAAVRKIVSEEARISAEDIEEGISNALRRRTVLDAAIEKFFQRLVDGDVEIEAKDIPKLVELREKLDKDYNSAAVDTLMVTHNAFKQAVLELSPPDLKWNILERTKEILDAEGAGQRAALTTGQDGTIEVQ